MFEPLCMHNILQDGVGCECMFEDKTYNRAIGEGTAPQMDAI